MSYIYLKYAAGVLDLYDLLIATIDDGDVDQLRHHSAPLLHLPQPACSSFGK